MVDWYVDRSLDKLLSQIDAVAPDRSRESDGSIGDTAHQGTDSEHNPEPKPGPDQVDARDITHDPDHGADMAVVSEALRKSRDRRILYVIFNRRYFSPRTGWVWVPYTGKNPHDKHMHISVNDLFENDETPWQIGIAMATLDQDDLTNLANAVWAKLFSEYYDENGNLVRDRRTTADILFSVHKAVLTSEPIVMTAEDRAAIVEALRADVGNVVNEAVLNALAGSTFTWVPSEPPVA